MARFRKIFDQATTAGYLNGTPLPPYPTALFEYKDDPLLGPVSDVDKELLKHQYWIKERREAGWHLITIFEELPDTDPDIEITRASFYRFIKRHKIDEDKERSRCRVRVIPETIHEPGDSLIVNRQNSPSFQ